jgi:hypothetical protein
MDSRCLNFQESFSCFGYLNLEIHNARVCNGYTVSKINEYSLIHLVLYLFCFLYCCFHVLYVHHKWYVHVSTIFISI